MNKTSVFSQLIFFLLAPLCGIPQWEGAAPNFKVQALKAEVATSLWIMDSPTKKAVPLKKLPQGRELKLTGRAVPAGKWSRKANVLTHMYEVKAGTEITGWCTGLGILIYGQPQPWKEAEVPEGLTNPDLAFPRNAETLNFLQVKDSIGFPDLARLARVSGTVKTKVLVSPQGNYLCHIRMEDPHPILTREVEKYIANLRFAPAYDLHGNAIEAWVIVPFEFR